MASFPTLSFGGVALYPLEESIYFLTQVTRFADNTEQRYRQSPRMRRFTLQLNGIPKTDVTLIENFFDTVKGDFDSTWDITIGGDLHTNMAFDSAELAFTEISHNRFNGSIPIRKTR